jgi:hypothetical protein
MAANLARHPGEISPRWRLESGHAHSRHAFSSTSGAAAQDARAFGPATTTDQPTHTPRSTIPRPPPQNPPASTRTSQTRTASWSRVGSWWTLELGSGRRGRSARITWHQDATHPNQPSRTTDLGARELGAPVRCSTYSSYQEGTTPHYKKFAHM